MKSRSPTSGLMVDPQVECALAAEAVFSFDRFLSFGVGPDDFSVESVRAVVEAAQHVWELGETTVNPDSVTLALQRAGKLQLVGGPRGLAELLIAEVAPDVDRLRMLKRLRVLRENLMRAVSRIEQEDLQGALDLASMAHADALNATTMGTVRTARELAHSLLEELRSGEPRRLGIHPGILPLAEAIGSVPVGGVLIIAGDTNVGKTSFVLEQLLAIAQRGDIAGYVSVEDPDELTAAKFLAVASGISSSRIQRRDIREHDWANFSRGMVDIDRFGERLVVSNCTGGSELDVCAAMTRIAQRGGRIAAVDYIGEIEASRSQQDRRNEVRWILKRLKVHAARLGMALIIVSQLRRPKDGEPGREPTKHDLKEAGDLENSAEAIVGLWRTEEHDFAPVHCKILKSKIGGNGVRWLMQRERVAPNGGPGSGRLRVVHEPEDWA